ncbi:flagellar basal body rod protein FlgB [Marinimicrobium agarilyticum]|uniref:flagellar basal body rod protein FlgB n=1 Tax=Marinimicrobium agarilyticum TaxID=306546 RepID=UPI0004220BB5|nr:flagellar basal body rod protein FlgB [Marinimicrobium agarilyticum]
MAISFESALGIHESAFKMRAQRAELLADNMANVDTPGYKAKDLDFRQALARQSGETSGVNLAATNARHMQGGNSSELGNPDVMYRVPQQPSIDGNTVEEHIEHAEYMKNALDFQASFQFLNGKFKGLTSALRGE